MGLIDQIRGANTRTDVQSLVEEARMADFMAEKTYRRVLRVAKQRIAFLGTKQPQGRDEQSTGTEARKRGARKPAIVRGS